MTTYTSLLGLALPVTGQLSGTWGDTVNDAITSLLDSAVAGTTTISADADITLTTTTGAANESREAILLWTAGGTVTRNITAPAQSKAYIVINKSSNTQSIVLRGVGPTTGVTIVLNEKAVCAWNGSDFVKVASSAISNLTGTLPVANGGTGLTTTPANGALDIGNGTGFTRTTLTAGSNVTITNSAGGISIASSNSGGTVTSVAATVPAFLSVAGSPITTSGTLAVSLSGTALPVANGGTGVTTSTGSGNVVLSTSPTLVTPILGTPTSGNLTNCTFPTLNQNTTGTAAGLSTTLAVASGGTGVTLSTGSGSVVLNTSPTLTTPTINSAQVATVSGSAPLFLCRAWVNFNGTGTIAIRGSGNVSSLTDNGVGDYTVNFTTAMPDTNYTNSGNIGNTASGGTNNRSCQFVEAGRLTGSVQVVTGVATTSGLEDQSSVYIAVFR